MCKNYKIDEFYSWEINLRKKKEFKTLMYKYELCEPNYRKNYFPIN